MVGCLLMLGGNGLVSWAEQSVASGLAALILATTPLWFVLIEWLPPFRKRPAFATLIGLALGFLGVGILVGPSAGAPGARQPDFTWTGGIVLMTACVCWATGSLVQRRAGKGTSPWMQAAMQMMCGAAGLLVVSLLTGEGRRLGGTSITWPAIWAWLYLVTFGSWVGFGAYVWLLKHSTPARVSTYAYVNPIIAVLLGWLVLSEPVTARVGWAAAVIVAGVVIVQWPRTARTDSQA
jgi:drug/metabolite transporter (DMT)-like permease